MSTEAKLQSEVIKFLRDRGCYVVKLNASVGVPVGAPDVFAVKEGFWCGLEVKASRTARKQPLQAETVSKLDEWSYCKFVWPENWPEVRAELEQIL